VKRLAAAGRETQSSGAGGAPAGSGGAGPTSGSGGTAPIGDAGGSMIGGAGGGPIKSDGGNSGAGGPASAGGAGGVSSAGGAGGMTTTVGVCDLFASGKAPCVAAHSTVRALYGAYEGKLYQVSRTSDKTTRDIGVLNAGGFADSAAQDTFCAGTTCSISMIYDQSGKNNHLKQAPAGQRKATPDNLADATALKLTLSGHPQGNFFEGVLTAGAASDATTNAVQANVVAAGYGR
jgi:hypothetical protein